MNIIELLSMTLSDGASDLIVGGGRIPCIKRLGRVSRVGQKKIDVSEIESFRRQLSTPDEESFYSERKSLDKSALISGVGRFRLNFLQSEGRPEMVARPILSGNSLFLKELMLPEILAEFASAPRGLLLISGSAGCGKSTTMGAIVNLINETREAHIVTIEDPVEFVHEDRKCFISQREVGRD